MANWIVFWPEILLTYVSGAAGEKSDGKKMASGSSNRFRISNLGKSSVFEKRLPSFQTKIFLASTCMHEVIFKDPCNLVF